MLIRNLDDLVAALKKAGAPNRVAVAACAEEHVLKALVHAAKQGVAEPVFIGDGKKSTEIAAGCSLDISGYRFVECPDDDSACQAAVDIFNRGEASLIMKGRVGTGTLLKTVLSKGTGIPTRGILSHVAVFRAPHEERIMLLSDAGVNIRPNMQRKVEILKNALYVARRLGLDRPKAAILAAIEKVNFPAMPATLDADLIARMSSQGEFGDALVAGPLSLDVAISAEAAACKGVDSPVAGKADILCAPDIESGNILYKAMTTLTGTTMAGVVIGSDAPLVVPSRGDSELSRFYSIALAAYLAGAV